MAPDAEDVEVADRRGGYRPVPVHGTPGHVGCRVQPSLPTSTCAWLEHEYSPRSENRRLLDIDPPSPKLQAGLTLGVWNTPKKYNFPQTPRSEKPKVKTKLQKRSEKLYSVLKPPYFIVSVIIVMVGMHLWGSVWARERLEWVPDAWWREPWRLFSYGAVHASATHLATNAIVALAVGWILEREQNRWQVAGVWACGLAAGALGAGVLQSHVRVVGASAAVYALLTAHLPNVCIRFGHIPLWWFRPLSVVVLATSESLSWLILHAPAEPGATAATTPVAWSAHALGAAVGVPAGFLIFTGENTSKKSILIGRVISALFLLAGTVYAVIYYAYWHEIDD